ncbi:hypothetical protein CL622_01735 [archaeon]|nr:hypothetical protein [archaeon]
MRRKRGDLLLPAIILIIVVVIVSIIFLVQLKDPDKEVEILDIQKKKEVSPTLRTYLDEAPQAFRDKHETELIIIDQLTVEDAEDDCLFLNLRNQCLYKLAVVKNDPTLCPKIEMEPYKSACENGVGK